MHTHDNGWDWTKITCRYPVNYNITPGISLGTLPSGWSPYGWYYHICWVHIAKYYGTVVRHKFVSAQLCWNITARPDWEKLFRMHPGTTTFANIASEVASRWYHVPSSWYHVSSSWYHVSSRWYNVSSSDISKQTSMIQTFSQMPNCWDEYTRRPFSVLSVIILYRNLWIHNNIMYNCSVQAALCSSYVLKDIRICISVERSWRWRVESRLSVDIQCQCHNLCSLVRLDKKQPADRHGNASNLADRNMTCG